MHAVHVRDLPVFVVWSTGKGEVKQMITVYIIQMQWLKQYFRVILG